MAERFIVIGTEPKFVIADVRSAKRGKAVSTLGVIYDQKWAEWICALLNDNNGRRADL